MKKFISILLSAIFLFSCALPAFAVDDEQCNCGESPIVYVAALGSGALFLDVGTNNERKLFRPETDDLIPILSPLIPAAADLINDGDYDKFGDVLIDCVNAAFGELKMDKNGDSTPQVTCEAFHPDTAEHGIDRSYYFGYDFRADPIHNAQLLKEYIEEVKKITNHDTVRLRASSMGGVVTMSYVKLYGTKDIETIILQCCPLLGTAVAGELFVGKVQLNANAIERYAAQAMPELENDFLGGVVYTLLEMLTAAGLIDGLVAIGDKLVSNLKDRLYDECLIPIFSTMPGIWSFVPDEYYEEAKKYMKLDTLTNAKLIDRLDFYHYDVQQSAEELINKIKTDGTNIYNVIGYNMQRTPLVTAYLNDSDGTVDTKYASLGATVGNINTGLPRDYIQKNYKDINYISPDRKIDASTSLLPESTWFIKDMMHSSTHDGHQEFYKILFNSEEQLTVFDLEEYPQFLQNDVKNQKFITVEEDKGTFLNSFTNFYRMPSFIHFIDFITKLFKIILP